MTYSSDRGVRDAGPRGERLFGGVLERLIGRQHYRGRAHLVVLGIDAGRDRALVDQRLGGTHQAMTRHDDAVVGGNEVLLGAIADRAHALLQRGVLARKTSDAAESPASLLGGAIYQIVVILVGDRPERAGYVFAVHAGAILHGVDFALCERACRMEI